MTSQLSHGVLHFMLLICLISKHTWWDSLVLFPSWCHGVWRYNRVWVSEWVGLTPLWTIWHLSIAWQLDVRGAPEGLFGKSTGRGQGVVTRLEQIPLPGWASAVVVHPGSAPHQWVVFRLYETLDTIKPAFFTSTSLIVQLVWTAQ